MAKEHLDKARTVKNDEFYTQYDDVEQGCQFYNDQLKGKTVLCNCDDYRTSNFVKYYLDNFSKIGLSRLIAINNHTNECYSTDNETEIIQSVKDGSFDSPDANILMQTADIVITNPPFSSFRRFFKHLIDNKKKFLIIAPLLAISYVEVFDLFLKGEVRIGKCKKTQMKFQQPNGELKGVPAIWLTNLDTPAVEPMELTATYNPEIHKKYDDFNGFINVRKLKECPRDYNDWMGLPITFLVHYCPEQFELSDKYLIQHDLHIDNKSVFLRVFTRLRK